MKNKPNIKKDKHVGLLFQPRSGSHVVRNYLAQVTGRLDLGELFNPMSDAGNWKLMQDQFTGDSYMNIEHDQKFVAPTENYVNQVHDNIKLLDTVEKTNNYGVFGVTLEYYLDVIEEVAPALADANVQFIKLERADVLFSILSLNIAINTGDFHNMVVPNARTSSLKKSKVTQINIPLNLLTEQLNRYIDKQRAIEKYFKNAPTIYYEQFQFSAGHLLNMFDGIPKRILSSPYLKLGRDYKALIHNLADVEDCYEKFVNDHKEYFPQYFDKLSHVQIPACQGKQPRDLSNLHDQLRAANC